LFTSADEERHRLMKMMHVTRDETQIPKGCHFFRLVYTHTRKQEHRDIRYIICTEKLTGKLPA